MCYESMLRGKRWTYGPRTRYVPYPPAGRQQENSEAEHPPPSTATAPTPSIASRCVNSERTQVFTQQCDKNEKNTIRLDSAQMKAPGNLISTQRPTNVFSTMPRQTAASGSYRQMLCSRRANLSPTLRVRLKLMPSRRTWKPGRINNSIINFWSVMTQRSRR